MYRLYHCVCSFDVKLQGYSTGLISKFILCLISKVIKPLIKLLFLTVLIIHFSQIIYTAVEVIDKADEISKHKFALISQTNQLRHNNNLLNRTVTYDNDMRSQGFLKNKKINCTDAVPPVDVYI